MKKIILIALAPLLAAPFAAGQEEDVVDPRTVGRLPVQRQGVVVQEGEGNPYGFPVQKKKEATAVKRQFSQEDQIREVLKALPVTGVIGNGRKVLLGDLILEEGEFVDDVLPGQTERLLVKEITDSKILIEWVEEFRRKNARNMKIQIDLKTRVQVLLKGQPDTPQKRMGIARSIDEEEAEE